jgi:pimeloyl-ACP methyl ester carboxylesterase
VDYLRKQKDVSLIGLWGRSMGSVSTLMHADRDPGLACIVLDSPFCSLNELAQDIAKNKAGIPNFIVGGVMSIVRGTIKEKAGFNIEDLNPLKNHVGKSYSPAFFLSAEDDELINPEHAKILHDAYKG